MTNVGPSPADVPPIEDWGRLLVGRTAVVTGGAAGIGQAICLLFAEHGAHVEFADIDSAAAEDTVAQITSAGGSARFHEVDVTRPDAVSDFAAAVLADHPNVSVLVNNVGDYRPLVRFAESSPESWQTMYAINLQHIFSVTHAFLPAMVKQHHGSIVNLHSVEAMRGYPGDPVYGAMKAGAAAFTTDLAISVGRHGVRVNGIGPDLIQTPQVDYLSGYEEQADLWPSWSASRTTRLADRRRTRRAVPCVGPVGVRHRPQHPGRRWLACRRSLVLLAQRRPIRESAPQPLPRNL